MLQLKAIKDACKNASSNRSVQAVLADSSSQSAQAGRQQQRFYVHSRVYNLPTCSYDALLGVEMDLENVLLRPFCCSFLPTAASGDESPLCSSIVAQQEHLCAAKALPWARGAGGEHSARWGETSTSTGAPFKVGLGHLVPRSS